MAAHQHPVEDHHAERVVGGHERVQIDVTHGKLEHRHRQPVQRRGVGRREVAAEFGLDIE